MINIVRLISAAIDSARLYPKVLYLSFGFCPIFMATKAIRRAAASLKLWSASAIRDKLPEINPPSTWTNVKSIKKSKKIFGYLPPPWPPSVSFSPSLIKEGGTVADSQGVVRTRLNKIITDRNKELSKIKQVTNINQNSKPKFTPIE